MQAAQLDLLFGALSDPTRRSILMSLQAGGAPVHEIANDFAMSRPAVSKHLAVLRGAGLVRETRNGRENVYALERDALDEARQWIGMFWRGRLGALKQLSEEEND